MRYEVDGDGIALVTWDMPGRSMNVMGPGSIGDWAACVDRAVADPAVKGLVVTSGKPAFIAGADLAELEQRSGDAQTIYARIQELHRIFRKMETGKKPFVAAINGTAMGGGLEVCLACHYRVVADDPKIQLGLPEAKVGLLPGAGGTQRMLRLLGAMEALPLLLEGRSLSPPEALKRKVVHAVVPREQLVDAAKKWVRENAGNPEAAVQPWDRKGFRIPGADTRTPQGNGAFAWANAMQRKKTGGNYPALDAIQSCIYEGSLVPLDAALRIEARYFTTLMLDPTSKNMIRTLFLEMQKANKLARRPAAVPKRELRKVGVLGAGMMGAAIAHVSAEAGLEVVLIDRDEALTQRGREHAAKQQQSAVEKGRKTKEQADAVVARITATTDYEKLRGAELVIEAVFEDRAVKAEVTKRAEAVLAADGVFASNTSTLPITGLAEVSVRPERFIGLHFFSPVERMPLVEIILGRRTGDEALALAMDYVQRIRKTPIVVNDSRGFYTSRVFATYTTEGMLMLAEGVAPALIENAGKATGMPVAPLALCDEVALDLIHRVTAQTRKDLGASYRERASDRLVAEMVEKLGRVGKKAGQGFYEYPKDGKKRLWSGLEKLAPAAASQPSVDELKERFLVIQSLEAARCYEERVVTDPADADVGAILGWGFAPWTGGPLSYIDTMGAKRFVETCDRLAQRHGERFSPSRLLREMASSGGSFYEAKRAAA
jgi:3-hydroxyacyl-CoA dehydrogenase/enoyl-CoA hydratase/3-hydroxybutyryl-CoA epimerase